MAEPFVAKVVEILEPGQSLHQVVNRFMQPTAITPEQEAHFKHLMENHKVSKASGEGTNPLGGERQLPSLIEEVRQSQGKTLLAEFTAQDPQQFKQNVVAFADNSMAKMETGKSLLLNREIDIKPSVAQLLQNKWTGIRTDVRNIHQSLSLEFKETVTPPEANTLLKPLQKFFGYLIDGQTQMQQLKTDVNTISTSSFSISDMLRIQLKMAHVSQELEFFTALLNKSLDSTKTLMNVQI